MLIFAPPTGSFTLDGTDGDDQIVIQTPDSLSPGATIDAKGGHDQLWIFPVATFEDSDFVNISNIEEVISSGGLVKLTLGAETVAAFGGAPLTFSTSGVGRFVIDARALDSGTPLIFSGSGFTDGNRTDVVLGGAGDDTLHGGGGADRLRAGAGDDLFLFTSTAHLNKAGLVLDGGIGVDTIRVTDEVGGSIADGAFTGVTRMEKLEFTAGTIELQLGAEAAEAFQGLLQVNALTASSLTLDASEAGAAGARLVLLGSAGNDDITGTGGADRLRGGAGDDHFRFADLSALADVGLLDGGIGTDIVHVHGGGTLTDADFARLSRIEGLTITAGAATLTLGSEAASAFGNILRIDASGAESLHLDGQALGANTRLVVTGSAGADIITDGAGSDRFTGGDGADTFIIADHGLGGSHDVITDFVAGEDVISLNGFAGLNYDELAEEMMQQGDDVLISFSGAGGETQYLLLLDTTLADLSADDFLFRAPSGSHSDSLTVEDASIDFADRALALGWRGSAEEVTSLSGGEGTDLLSLDYAGAGVTISDLAVDFSQGSETTDNISIEAKSEGRAGSDAYLMAEPGEDGEAASTVISDISIMAGTLNLSIEAWATAGDGGAGGQGHDGVMLDEPAGTGGTGGQGGAAETLISGLSIQASGASNIEIHLIVDGGAGGIGGTGGWGATVTEEAGPDGNFDESYLHRYGIGGQGGDGGAFGTATARIEDNVITLGNADDFIALTALVSATAILDDEGNPSDGSGAPGDGTWNWDWQEENHENHLGHYYRDGEDGAPGAASPTMPTSLIMTGNNIALGGGDDYIYMSFVAGQMTIDGNVFDGGEGANSLVLTNEGDSLILDPGAEGVTFDLRAHKLLVGEGVSTLLNFDTLGGTSLDDRFVDGAGNQEYAGWYGSDTFVFADGHGHDLIYAFETGMDKLVFEGMTMADLTILAVETGTMITSGEGDTILLFGYTAPLGAEDMVFA
ncbi:calcium-binding protein [Acetobacteraceae bacterium H6797]|nr:calcium-binding protein [Acetobacteraceae bacterium H6797]